MDIRFMTYSQFRNWCLNTLYGRIPSYAYFTTNRFDVKYWECYDDDDIDWLVEVMNDQFKLRLNYSREAFIDYVTTRFKSRF